MMPDYSDYDPEDCRPHWVTLRDSRHTARTPKTCSVCGGAIAPGQRYHRLIGLEDGEFVNMANHLVYAECEEAERQRRAWEAEAYREADAWASEQGLAP